MCELRFGWKFASVRFGHLRTPDLKKKAEERLRKVQSGGRVT